MIVSKSLIGKWAMQKSRLSGPDLDRHGFALILLSWIRIQEQGNLPKLQINLTSSLSKWLFTYILRLVCFVAYYVHKVPIFFVSKSNFLWRQSPDPHWFCSLDPDLDPHWDKKMDPYPHWHTNAELKHLPKKLTSHFCCSGGMRSGDALRRGSSAGRPPGGVPGLQRVRPELRHYRQQCARTRHREGGLCLLHLRHGDRALPEGDDCGVCRALPAGGRAGQVTTNVVFSWCRLPYSGHCSRILSPWLGYKPAMAPVRQTDAIADFIP